MKYCVNSGTSNYFMEEIVMTEKVWRMLLE